MSTRSIDQILISFRHRNPVDSFLHLKSTSKSSPWFLPDAGLNQNRRRNILGFESVKTHSSKLDNKIWPLFDRNGRSTLKSGWNPVKILSTWCQKWSDSKYSFSGNSRLTISNYEYFFFHPESILLPPIFGSGSAALLIWYTQFWLKIDVGMKSIC